MNSKTDIGTAKEIKVQVITSENRKAMLYDINIHNKSSFMDTAVTKAQGGSPEKSLILSSKTCNRIIGFQTYHVFFCLNVNVARRIFVHQCHGFFAGFCCLGWW